mmetsp:Transcript_79266/g.245823  ORF Transcript_79266/g.245823 Transcript_79266/m.245823 type:complete len:238 (-) Transcript_79266:31-744(-)
MPSLQMVAKLLNGQTMEALKHPLDTPKRLLECAAASPRIRSPSGQAPMSLKFEDLTFPASPQGSRSPAKRPSASLQCAVAAEAARRKHLAGDSAVGDAACLDGSPAPSGAERRSRASAGTAAPRPPAAAEEGGSGSLHAAAREAYLARAQRIGSRRLPLHQDTLPQDSPQAQAAPRPARGCPKLLGREGQAGPAERVEGVGGEPQGLLQEAAAGLGASAHAAFLARQGRRSARRLGA